MFVNKTLGLVVGSEMEEGFVVLSTGIVISPKYIMCRIVEYMPIYSCISKPILPSTDFKTCSDKFSAGDELVVVLFSGLFGGKVVAPSIFFYHCG